MSDGEKGGWKLVFRQDEIDTLKLVLAYVIDRHEWSLGPARNSNLTGIDETAHKISLARVQEIKAYIEQVCG